MDVAEAGSGEPAAPRSRGHSSGRRGPGLRGLHQRARAVVDPRLIADVAAYPPVRFGPHRGTDVEFLHEGGLRCRIGTITTWQPPNRFAMSFCLALDPDHPTTVGVDFARDGSTGTQLTLTHGGWGPDNVAQRGKFNAWPALIERDQRHVIGDRHCGASPIRDPLIARCHLPTYPRLSPTVTRHARGISNAPSARAAARTDRGASLFSGSPSTGQARTREAGTAMRECNSCLSGEASRLLATIWSRPERVQNVWQRKDMREAVCQRLQPSSTPHFRREVRACPPR